MNTQVALSTTALNPRAVIGNNAALELPKLTPAQMEAINKTMAGLQEKLSAFVSGDEVNDIIIAIDTAKKDLQAGPWKLVSFLKDPDHIPVKMLSLFPTPGTTAETSDVPDTYYEPYFRDGNKKFRKTSFYLKLFLGYIPEGKRIAQALQHIALAKDEKANQTLVPDDMRKINDVDLENMREDLVSQQNSGVKALRDAVGLIKQLDAVNNLAKVSAMPLMDEEGNVRRCPKPIKVWNTDNPEAEWKLYSVSGFMQFDPAKASEIEGGTFDSLKLTAKREQGEDDNDPATATAPVAINTAATMVARLNDIHEFISNKLMADPKREAYGLFLKDHIAVAGSDDLIETLDDIRTFCAKVLAIPSVAARLEDIASRPVKDKAA